MRILFLFSLLFTLGACSDTDKAAEKKITKVQNEDKYDAEITAIENEINKSSQVASSMRYTKDDASIVVLAHLNKAGEIIKIEEEYNEGNGKNSGVNAFYYRKDEIFATREYYTDASGAEPCFKDRITFYEKGKPVQSKEKKVVYEEELEGVEYHIVEPKGIKVDRAKNVLDQKGDFETTFQGFVDVAPLKYLIVGSKNSNGYTTALRVDYEDEFIKTLLANPKKYLNQKVAVEFQGVVDETGFAYQTYLSGKFVD